MGRRSRSPGKRQRTRTRGRPGGLAVADIGGGRGLGPQVPFVVCLLVLAASVAFFLRGWLDNGIPGEDFPGNVAHISEMRKDLSADGRLSPWTDAWFLGQPRTMHFAKFLSCVPGLLLAPLAGEVAAIKIVLGVFHLLSGLSMFVLLGGYVRDRALRTVAALLYAIHPMALIESGQKGHMEVSMFYAVVPFVFWLAGRLYERPAWGRSFLLGVFLALGLWMNNEGSFVTFPFLALLFGYGGWLVFMRHLDRAAGARNAPGEVTPVLGGVCRSLAHLAGALLCAAALGAFFWVPVLAERTHFSFFRPEMIGASIRDFSYRNPFYMIDRGGDSPGNWGALPEHLRVFRGQLYLGVLPLLLAAVAAFSGSLGRSTGSWPRRGWFLMAAVSLCFSFGPFSVLGSLTDFPSLGHFLSPYAAVASMAVCASVVAAALWWRRVRRFLAARQQAMLFGAIVVAVGSVVPWFLVLRAVMPVYGEMRAPIWFFVTPCVFATCVLAALGIEALSRLIPCRYHLPLAGALFLAVVADYRPYARTFYVNQLPRPHEAALHEVGDFLRGDSDWFRILSAESYSPLLDLLPKMSGKRSAWSWLNWSSLKNTSDLVLQSTYPRLYASNTSAVAEGAMLAGMANVKYLVDDLSEPPNLPRTATDVFPLVRQAGPYAIYRNPCFEPFVRVYTGAVGYCGDLDDDAVRLTGYCTGRGIAVYDLDPPRLAYTNPGNMLAVFWNRDAPTPDPGANSAGADGAAKTLVNMKRQEPFALPTLPAPRLTMSWERRTPDRISLRMSDGATTEPLYLVISESWAPGWRAEVDGKPTRVHRANHAFLAVTLDPGAREASLHYERPSCAGFAWAISLLFLAGSGLAAFGLAARSKSGILHAGIRTAAIGPWLRGARKAVRNGLRWTARERLSASSPAAASSSHEQASLPRTGAMTVSSRLDILLALLTGLFGLCLYQSSLAPTVTAEDSGELVTAAYHLGVPHPPGYPLFTVSGYVFSHLPLGPSPAWRVNLMSACYGALTGGVLFLILRHIRLAPLLCFFASATFLASNTFWSQSVIAEVYSQNAFANALMILFALEYGRRRRVVHLHAATACLGLGIACHYMTLLLAVPLAAFLLAVNWRVLLSPRIVATSCLVLLLSLSPMLLPWAFAQHAPPVNWGNPNTFPAWLDQVRRVQYRNLEFSENVPVRDKVLFLANYFTELSQQVSLLGIAMAVYGFARLLRTSWRTSVLVGGVFFVNGVALTLLLHFRYVPINLMRVEVYYIPSYLAAWIAVAYGFQEFVLPRTRRLRWPIRLEPEQRQALCVAAIGLSALALAVSANWRTCNMRDYWFAKDYADNIFRSLRPNAVLLPIGDHQTFPILYYQAVEGRRKDVLIGDLYGYLEPEVYEEYERVAKRPASGLSRSDIEVGLARQSDRPVYFFSNSILPENVRDVATVAMGLCYEAMPIALADAEATRNRQDEFWRRCRARGVDAPGPHKDEMACTISGAYPFMRGELELSRGRVDEALRCYETHISRCNGLAEAIGNVGCSLAKHGLASDAERYFLRALRKAPGNRPARENLAILYLSQNRFRPALDQVLAALAFFPGDESLSNWARDIQSRMDADRSRSR